jgi:hypothetical protein
MKGGRKKVIRREGKEKSITPTPETILKQVQENVQGRLEPPPSRGRGERRGVRNPPGPPL